MNYIVPGMKLVKQDMTMACWYASAKMVVDWKRNRQQATSVNEPDPSQVKKWQALYKSDAGMTNAQIPVFAKDLGLRMVPPMSPTPNAILGWLHQFGPLWVNGVGHITVIAGIRDTGAETEVLVYDPAKPASPGGEWKSLAKWYVGDNWEGRDTSSGVQTVFLHAA